MASYTYFAVELGDEHALGCKCCRFSSGTDLPVPKKLTNDEIAVLARKFSHQIFADWTKLNAILKRFEEVIQKRWMKKNEKKRRAILLQAWPEMAPTHRPDFVGFRKVFKNTPRSRTMLSKSYLWPYINLEDLLQRHLLLLFINSRGRNLPDRFVSMDVDSAHLGKGWNFDDDNLADGTIVRFDPVKHKDGVSLLLLHEARDPCTYGKIVVCKGDEPLNKSAFMYHPGFGLLGLEIQQGIYSFLLDVVKLILHDVEPDQFFLAPHMPAPPVPRQKTEGWLSFSAQTLEAPYGVPQILDLDRIKSLVSARRSAAEDHLWLLREDPGYFLETLKDWKEHDTITVKHSCSRCYNVVAAKMISDAFTYFSFWDHISKLLQDLPPLEDQLRRADLECLRLPRKEELVWAEILEVVDYLIFEPINALRIGVPPSPRLRHCFDLPDHPSTSDPLTFKWSPKWKISDSERRVTGLVLALVDSEQRELHSLNHIIQEFQYMMETDPASADLIDPWINSQIADLALLSELKLRVEGLQPWSTGWKSVKIHRTNPVKRNVDSLIRTASLDVRDCLLCLCLDVGYELLSDPLDGRLDYPITRVYTKANVNQMRRAERNLAEFWKDVDDDLRASSGRSLTSLMNRRLSEPRKKHRTPPWKEPAVKPAISATPKTKAVLKELSNNVAIPHAASSTKPEVSLPTPKNKIKTRGVASSPAVAEPEPRAATPDEDGDDTLPKETVPVSKRAFRALDALLPSPTSSSHQRAELSWNELLSALDEIGLQPEKLYGSVWVFKPRAIDDDGEGADGSGRGNRTGKVKVKVDVTRSISFHEPKEVRRGHKIPSNMVRTFGRRLKHAFGWWDGMFVCE